MLFLVASLWSYCHPHHTQAAIGGPRHEDPPGTRGEKGGQAGSEITILSEEEASTAASPKIAKGRVERQWVPPRRVVDENASGRRGSLRTWVWVYI